LTKGRFSGAQKLRAEISVPVAICSITLPEAFSHQVPKLTLDQSTCFRFEPSKAIERSIRAAYFIVGFELVVSDQGKTEKEVTRFPDSPLGWTEW